METGFKAKKVTVLHDFSKFGKSCGVWTVFIKAIA